MDSNITKKLAAIKTAKRDLAKQFKEKEAELDLKTVDILKEAMESEGLDELILIFSDERGLGYEYMSDAYESIKSDEVDFSGNEIIVREGEWFVGSKEVEFITRFGIRDGQLFYHTAKVDIDGDSGSRQYVQDQLNIDNWQDPWIPIKQFPHTGQLQRLIVKCLAPKSAGIWRFSKSHPECHFLHRYLTDNDIALRIKAANDDNDIANIFSRFTALESIDLTGITTKEIKSAERTFYHCSSLKELDLSKLDTHLCKNFESMLNGCSSLQEVKFGEEFNTSEAETFQEMFRDCSSLTSLDLSTFDTRKAKNFAYMFYDCKNLKTINLSGWEMNTEENWCDRMFENCDSLEEVILIGASAKTIELISNQLQYSHENVAITLS